VIYVGTHVSFRDVDAGAFREFKAAVASQGMTMGIAVSEALRLFAKQFKEKKGNKMSLLDLKPVDYGPGSENMSQRIDEVLYGWKK